METCGYTKIPCPIPALCIPQPGLSLLCKSILHPDHLLVPHSWMGGERTQRGHQGPQGKFVVKTTRTGTEEG